MAAPELDPAPGPEPTVRPETSGERTAIRLLADLHSEVSRADSKASVLVGAEGVAAGLLVALLTGAGWRPAQLSPTAAAMWWAGAASLVVSLLALLLAVLPRYGVSRWRPGSPVTCFADIRRAADRGELVRALDDTARNPVAGLVHSLAANSHIVNVKHRWVRIGLVSFCAGIVLLPGSLLIG